jgi:hypothetical protein
MPSFLRLLSGVLGLAALAALSVLVATDLRAGFQPSPHHQHAGALALMLSGASFACQQLSCGRSWGRLRGVLLGVAFVLWGGEQYLPAGPAVTAIDCLVIVFFVADLGLMIWTQRWAPPP